MRPGDTLSAIAAALAVKGGWPALYAANRPAIGPDPGLIRAGTVLALPGPAAPARYAVAPGDTLSGIATALGVKGGWPALYAANRRAIGPDPALIRPGTVLTAPRQAATPAAAPHRAAPHQAAPGSPPAAATRRTAPPAPPGGRQAPPRPVYQAAPGQAPPGHLTAPGRLTAPAPAGGMPRWLVDLLLAAGVLAATAFAAEPAAAIARRRKATGPGPTTRPDKNTRPGPADRPGTITRLDRNARPGTADHPGTISRLDRNARPGTTDRPAWVSWLVPTQRSGKHRVSGTRDLAKRAAEKAKIILADHERLIVTYSIRDHTVYVLTPPGEDPRTVLAAARLVVPEDTYQDLAGHLGVPSAWPLE